jgi:FlaG/FlaF family flagellin (archaellin)
MVMITVVLAAVIAAFVFGMSGNIAKAKIVAVNVQKLDTNEISVIYLGGQDSRDFSYATINVTDDDGNYVKADNLANVVGNQVIVESNNKFTKYNRVVVVGYFTDGLVQVLLETRV